MSTAVEWWTPRQVAARLGYDASTVRRWCEAGRIEAARMPGGTWRIHANVVADLEARGNAQLRKRDESKAGPEWTGVPDYFEETESSPKARVRT